MSIAVKLSPILAKYTDNLKVANVNGNTIGECLEHLVKQFPALKQPLFEKNGRLHRYINIYVNQESAYPEELAKPIKDGDELHIVMVISGG